MSHKIQYMNAEQFEELLNTSDIPVILDFFSDDCPPCDVLAPILEKMAEKYGDYIKFVKIMRQENRELALKYGVTGSPTVLFFQDGKETGSRLGGFMTKPQVRKAIEEILGNVLPPAATERIDCELLILGGGRQACPQDSMQAGPEKYVRTEDTEYYAKAVILATGSRPRTLDAAGAAELKGRGVHYCATCDGAMYEGADVIVVGGGSAAIEEAVFLTKYADHVTIVHRRDGFRAAQVELDEARENKKVTILTNKVVKEVRGGEYVLKEAVLKDVRTGKDEIFPAAGAFVYVGNDPQTQMFRGQIKLDEMGYIIAGEDTKTSLDGVFAAGDVRTKTVRQVATAASDGAVAAVMAEKYLSSLK